MAKSGIKLKALNKDSSTDQSSESIQDVKNEYNSLDKNQSEPIGLLAYDYIEYIASINRKIQKVERRLRDVDEKILDADKKLENSQKETEKKIEDKQTKSIEILGIFVALFSYISITIQIFNRVSDAWSAGLFALLLLCSLLVLVFVQNLLLGDKPKSFWDYRVLIIIFIFLVSGGTIFALKNVPLNPVPATIEFQDLLESKVSEKIERSVSDNTYTKDEIDLKTASFEIFKDCVNEKKSVWLCVN